MLPPSLADVAATSKESPFKVLKDQVRHYQTSDLSRHGILCPCVHHEIEIPTCSMMTTDSLASRHSLLKPHDQK
jgi:hypothetical protein